MMLGEMPAPRGERRSDPRISGSTFDTVEGDSSPDAIKGQLGGDSLGGETGADDGTGAGGAGIALVGRRGGRVTRSTMDLPHGGTGSVSLKSPQGGFDRVTAVLVNTDIRRRGYEGAGKPSFAAGVGTR